MKLLLLTAYFPPEIGSAANLFFELGSEFVKRGHEVTVLTSYPTYNIDPLTLENRYRKGFILTELVNGMRVIRIRAFNAPRHIMVLRGLGQFLSAWVQWLFALFNGPRRAHVILVYSPPLFLGMTALMLRPFKKAKTVLNIQDLFPQSAIDLGVLRNSILISVFRRVESLLYKRSNAITVHSGGNKNHVVRCGGDSARTHIVPNVVDTRSILPGERVNAFRQRYGIPEHEFLISFAGVIGLSQDLDTVLDAAELLRDQSGLVFRIVGDGLEKPRLMKRALGLNNVRFLPMLGKEEYVGLLQASDVCLATLRKEVKTPVVPSKILSIMAAGRPVLASMQLEGDAPEIIHEASCGICVEPGNARHMAEALLSLRKDPARAASFGANGRKYVEKHFSLEACINTYDHLFQELMNHNK